MANPHLQYALSRLQGVNSNRVMSEPLNGGGDAGPTSQIRFAVPSNTLWDTRGTILAFDAQCTGAQPQEGDFHPRLTRSLTE